jgi:hypothetical protein
VVYFQSLTFVYVEGNDAASVGYHLLGRNESVLPRYAGYQLGLDYALSLLPPDGRLIRTVAMSITAATACCLAILMIVLAFALTRNGEAKHSGVIALGSVLSIPEFFYLGLVYTPMTAGMCCAVGAHMLTRTAVHEEAAGGKSPKYFLRLAVAGVMLLVGAFIRFEVSLYLLFIAADIFLLVRRSGMEGQFRRDFSRAALLVLVGMAVAIMALLWLPTGIWNTVLTAAAVALATRRFQGGIVGLLGTHQTVLTPAAIVFGLAGLFVLWKSHRSLVSLALLAILSVLVWPLWMSPKHLLMFAPPMFMCVIAGLTAIAEQAARSRRPALLVGMAATVLLMPWVVGLRASAGDSAWGPAFELRPFSREYSEEWSIRPLLGEGAAVPTTEGPRALWGHGHVLLGGAWRQLVASLDAEQRLSISQASESGAPFLVVRGTTTAPIAVAMEGGFSSLERLPTTETSPLRSRTMLTGKGGARVLIAKASMFDAPDVASTMRQLRSALGHDTILVEGYPAELRTYWLVDSNAIWGGGRQHAWVSLARLEFAFAARQERSKSD